MSDLEIELQELYARYRRMLFHNFMMRMLQAHTDFIVNQPLYRVGWISQRVMYVGIPFPNDSFTSLN